MIKRFDNAAYGELAIDYAQVWGVMMKDSVSDVKRHRLMFFGRYEFYIEDFGDDGLGRLRYIFN